MGVYKNNNGVLSPIATGVSKNAQVTILPTASASNVGEIFQYIGSTTASYTNGYFYKCVQNGVNYLWTNIDVQTGGGASSDNVVEGYFNSTDNLFYEESTYTTPIIGRDNTIYISLDTDLLYRYNSSIFIRVDEVNISDKADKVTSATNGDLASLNASGNLVDSGIASTNVVVKSATEGLIKNDGAIDTNTYLTDTDIADKADKVDSATNGDLAGLDANGNLTDSGILATNVITKSNTSGLVKNDGTIDESTYLTPVSSATNGDLAGLNASGELTDSGILASNVIVKSNTTGLVKNDGTIDTNTYLTSADIADKADVVDGATADDFATLDASGNLTDSGINKNIVPSNASSSNKLATANDIPDEISDLDDVEVTNPVNAQILAYNSTSGKWENQTGQAAIGGAVFKGSINFSNLPTTGMINGDWYDIKDAFTTDNRFEEGSGIACAAGTDVIWVDTDSKWNILTPSGVYSFNGRVGAVVPASSDYDASDIDYDNTTSGLTATDVQDAIDEINTNVNNKADLIDLAPAFDTTRDYSIGDFVTYNNDLYCFYANKTAGAWDNYKATKVTIGDKLESKINSSEIANEFSPSGYYEVGDFVTRYGEIYICTANHSASAWDNNHFSSTNATYYVTKNIKNIDLIYHKLNENNVANYLDHDVTSQTISGLTVTVADNKVITINGTSNESVDLVLATQAELQAIVDKYNADLFVNGTPVVGYGAVYEMMCSYSIDGTGHTIEDIGWGMTIPAGATITRDLIIGISNGVTFDNVSFYPMISEPPVGTAGRIYFNPNDYRPYAKTNRELTVDIDDMTSDVSNKADLTDIAPAFSESTAYNIGRYVTYNGDLYRFTSDHSAGAWNSNHVTKITVSEDLSSKQNLTSFVTTDFTVLNGVIVGDELVPKTVFLNKSTTPTQNDEKAITSGAVYTALSNKANKVSSPHYNHLINIDIMGDLADSGVSLDDVVQSDIIASDFSSTTAYKKGDYVFYGLQGGGKELYRFIEDHPAGGWTFDTELVAVMDEVVDLQNSDKANTQLISESIWGESGKNLLSCRNINATTNGITFITNNDGSITANGTATTDVWITLNLNYSPKSGDYILNGCPADGENNKYLLEIVVRNANDDADEIIYKDFGNGVNVNIPADGRRCPSFIVIRNGQTVSNLVFKPMFRDASILDPTYEPYHNGIATNVNANTALINESIWGESGKNIWSTKADSVVSVKSGTTYTLANNVYTVNCDTTDYAGIYWSTVNTRPLFTGYSGVKAILSFDVKADAEISGIVGFSTAVKIPTTYIHCEYDIADLSQIDAITFYSRDTSNARTITVKNMMIRLADVFDPTYEPYHESVKDTLRDEWVINSKNKLNIQKVVVNPAGITPILNDGIINLMGTATADAYVTMTESNIKNEYAGMILSDGGLIPTSLNNKVNIRVRIETDEGVFVRADVVPTNGEMTIPILESGQRYRIDILVKNGADMDSGVIIKPMIRLATEIDPSYEPYHTDLKGTLRNAEVVKGKNLFKNVLTNRSTNNINVKVNMDGTVVLDTNGEAVTTTTYLDCLGGVYFDAGNYIWNGCPINGSDNTYRTFIRTEDTTQPEFGYDYGEGKAFTLTSRKPLHYYITISTGAILNNLVFKPMLRLATETDPTYEPYYTPLKDSMFRRTEQNILGAKNLLNNKDIKAKSGATVTYTNSGITCVVSTATTWCGADYTARCNSNTYYDLTLDTIITSGITYVAVQGSTDGTTYTNIKTSEVMSTSGSVDLQFYTGNQTYLKVIFYTTNATTTTCNVTLSSIMLRLASDPDTTFAPYAMTNKQLTDKVVSLDTYLENSSVVLSTSDTTTVTFTSDLITANSVIDYACTVWDLVPDDISATTGSCTITLPKVDSAMTVGVRIYIR